MKINEITQSVLAKKYIFIEDPLNGSPCVANNYKMLNSYIIINNNIEKMRKIISLESKEDNGIYVVINDSITIPLDETNDVFILKKEYFVDEKYRKILSEKYRIPDENIMKLNIYTANIVSLESITNKIFQQKYPYFHYNIDYVGDTYVADIYTMYNDDVLINRKLNTFSGGDLSDILLETLYFISNKIYKGPIGMIIGNEPNRVYINGLFLELMDIENGIFIMKDLINDEIMMFNSNDISDVLRGGTYIGKDFLYFINNGSNDAVTDLYQYAIATKEEKYKFDMDQLLNDYESLIGDLEDSKIVILDKEGFVPYFSKKGFEKTTVDPIDKEQENEQTEE